MRNRFCKFILMFVVVLMTACGELERPPLAVQVTVPPPTREPTKRPTEVPIAQPSATPLPTATVSGLAVAADSGSAETSSKDDQQQSTGRGGEQDRKAPSITPTEETDTAATPLTPPTDLTKVGDGFACFGSWDHGLTCILQDGTWQTYDQDNSPIQRSGFISKIKSCGQDKLAIVHSNSVAIFDGATFQSVGRGWGILSPEDVACDSGGGLWAAHYEGVSYFDGSVWTTFDSDTFFAGDKLVNSVQVGADGTVWVMTTHTLGRYDGDNWILYTEKEMGDQYFLDNLIVSNEGDVTAAMSHGLVMFDGNVWSEKRGSTFFYPQSIDMDGTGRRWLGTLNDGILVYEDGNWRTFSFDSGDISSNGVDAVKIDEAGRVWAGTDFGINVFSEGEWTNFRVDNSGLLANQVTALGVAGGGPPLPQLVKKLAGAVAGTLTFDGKAMANADVLICVEVIYGLEDGSIACEEQPYWLRSKTDRNGQFQIENVPAGQYSIIAESASGWTMLAGEYGFSSEFFTVQASAETQLGEVEMTLDD